jgi:dTDP-4-amino-4,6-dideoxygalactose transaminase
VMPLKLLGADLIFTDLNRHGQQDLSNIPVSGVKAIMTTGLYGDCPDHDLVADTGVPIINDSCQAFLSKYKGKEATSIGDASAISFAQNKNCPVFGTYGAVLTDNDDWNDQFSYLRRCGYVSKGDGTLGGVGINAQPHADKCVQVYTALEFVDKWQARRQEVAQRLKEGLRDTGVRLRTSPDYSTTNNHKFVLFVKQNTEFMKKLAGFGIQSQLHYRYNFANNKILNTGEAKDFPMTDFFNKHAITIPSNPWLTTAEVGRIIEAVKNSLTKHDLEIAI